MDAPQAVLMWDRGALEVDCDRAAAVQAGVEAYLGRSAFAADGEVVVRVSLSRSVDGGAARVVAKVTQEDAGGRALGERIVSESSCASLDEPLTLVVALMLDAPVRPEAEQARPSEQEAASPPHAGSQSPREKHGESVPGESVAGEPETGEIETAPSWEKRPAVPAHATFLGLGVVSLGALPGSATGGRLAASIKPRGFIGLGVDLMLLAPERAPLGTGSLRISLAMASGSVCPLQGLDADIWYSACVGLGVARVGAQSEGLLESKSRSDWIAWPTLGVRGARLVWRQLLIGGGLDAAFPLSPDRYVYRDAAGEKHAAFELSSLVVTANLGVGVLLR